MTTGSDIVTFGLKKAGVLGVGRVASASDSSDALADLNDMISEWVTQRWMVWELVLLSKVSTGALSYTIGPAGDFNVTRRPDRLESAFQRQLNVSPSQPIDTPLTVIPSAEQYDRISMKRLRSFGLSIFLDSSYPLGVLKLYPVPNASIYEIFIRVKGTIPVLALNSVLSVPSQYISALKFNLARRLRQAYGKGLKPDIELNRFAANSLSVIQNSNIQIPELVMPDGLVRNSGYNIFSDQYGSTG